MIFKKIRILIKNYKVIKISCSDTVFCRGYYFFFKFKFSSFSPSNFPHLNCPPCLNSTIIKHTLVSYYLIRNLLIHTPPFIFQHLSPFFIHESVFSRVSKLSLKERRRKIARVLMIEHILNLQNKKAMKRDIKVEFLYLFIHAPCMLELFPRKKTQTTLKLRLLNWSDPGYCGYEAAPEKQGRIRHKPLYWEKPLQQPSKLQW